MKNFKLTSGLLALALAGMTAQAAAPALDYEINGNNLVINYTGTLLQSSDAVTWSEVTSASSPYKIALSDKKLFFCAKASDEPVDPLVPGQDATVSLPGGVALDLNWIEPGTFLMGSPEDELGAGGDEILHQVTLTGGYWLGKYEVTQAQYEAVMGGNPSHFKGADLPVEMVNWKEAMDFCAKLTEIEKDAGRLPAGYEYTLPTEAQWEYACRAGTTTAFNNGTNIEAEDQIYGECPNLDEIGWYWCNSTSKTHPAGQKLPNAWGLYDMHGNVYEWCLDQKNKYPETPVTDPVETGTDDDYRAIRGGSYSYYDDGAKYCRSAARNVRRISATDYSIGFRVALVHTGIEGANITIPLSDTVNLDMIWIEAGTFLMGSPSNELGRGVDEFRHEVTLLQDYWLGKYEVTQAQYEAVMGTNPSNWKGADLPVNKVSWNDAMAFCKKLTEIEKAAGRLPEGYEYTLPTEAQWEYACRAGTTTAFNNGTNIPTKEQEYKDPCPNLDEVGWYGFNSGYYDSDGNTTSNGKTFPVGQKQPNAWGLYDMHGNVYEWCLDWSGDYPASSVIDPKGPSTGSKRMARGGSWIGSANHCRSALRFNGDPSKSYGNFGFRVALKSNKGTLVITLDDSKEYDGTPLVSTYSTALASGLLDGDKLTAGVVTSTGSKVGFYSYPNACMITKPFETAMGITNYNVAYVIKQSITENITVLLPGNVKLDMIWINPGTFMMGSPEDELGRFANREVQHQVTLTQGYWLGKYEVTQAQYEAIMKANPSKFIGADLPVECVTWNDAMDFCKKLTEIEKAAGRLPEGCECTLPTEAQWEYACRAGTTTAFNNGTNIEAEEQIYGKCPNLDEVGWYNGNETHPVGQKQPNAWGLYDMHGNVYEFCLDWYVDYSASSVTDPTGPETGARHVERGGSRVGFASDCRSASRGISSPGDRASNSGFRVVLVPVK